MAFCRHSWPEPSVCTNTRQPLLHPATFFSTRLLCLTSVGAPYRPEAQYNALGLARSEEVYFGTAQLLMHVHKHKNTKLTPDGLHSVSAPFWQQSSGPSQLRQSGALRSKYAELLSLLDAGCTTYQFSKEQVARDGKSGTETK